MKQLLKLKTALPAILTASLLTSAIALDYPADVVPGSIEPGSEEWKKTFAVDQAPARISQKPAIELDGATTLTTVYKGKLAGMNIGRLYLTSKLTPTTYHMDYKVEQKGIAKWFDNSETDTVSYGTLADGKMTALYYSNHERDKNSSDYEIVEMTRQSSDSRFRLWTEPEAVLKRPVPPEMALHTVDPLGALALLGYIEEQPGKDVCDRTIPVFDGKRRFDMRLVPAGTKTLKRRGKKMYEGFTHRCQIFMDKVAGYKAKDYTKKQRADAYVYLAPVPAEAKMPNLTYLPVLVEGQTGIARATLEAKDPTITLADGTEIRMGRNK
jgi:hypothetical protein